MTNLEHLIENCLCEFEKGRSSEEIKQSIKKDINFENAGITAEQCYEICQYVWCVFVRNIKKNIEEDMRYMTDKEQIEGMTSIIAGEQDVCVRMKQLMDCKYCTCKNENGECGFSEYIARTFFAEGYHKTIWHKVVDGDIPKYAGEIIMAVNVNGSIITTTGRYALGDFYISDVGRIEKEKVIAWAELPDYFKHKPLVNITNRQWLESLSDEQWAKMIPCFEIGNPFANCPKNIDCIKCKIDWLNAEHKE